MVGNQIEEVLLKDQNHPSHRDRSPGTVLFGIALIVAGIGVMAALDLALWAEFAIAGGVVLTLGLAASWLGRRLARGTGADRARAELSGRAEHEAGLAARIASARASGAFRRWETERPGPGANEEK